MAAYAIYFDNPFENLRMGRADYKAQAQYTLQAVRQAAPGAGFTPLLAELEAALAGFDSSLTERGQPTAAGTDAYKLARKAWLTFVDDTMKDYVTPRLRKLPAYANFKAFGKSRLAVLRQDELLVQSRQLLALYAAHQAALAYPSLVAEATASLQAVATADQTRDAQAAATDSAMLDLAQDRAAIARAQRRLKAQLELAFDDPAKVYSFFDFSRARGNKKQVAKAMPAA